MTLIECEYELAECQKYLCENVDYAKLRLVIEEYLKENNYSLFKRELLEIFHKTQEEEKKNYKFYFLVNINGTMKILMYETLWSSRWRYKNNLQTLVNYLHCSENSVCIKSYLYSFPEKNYARIDFLFQRLKESTNSEKDFIDNINLHIKEYRSIYFITYIFMLTGMVYYNLKANFPLSIINENSIVNIFNILAYMSFKELGITIVPLAILAIFILIDIYNRSRSIMHMIKYFKIFLNVFFLFLGIQFFGVLAFNGFQLKIYIEAMGYPKIGISHSQSYIIMGEANEKFYGYDLRKSLSTNLCQELMKNQSQTEYFFTLLSKSNTDYMTPLNAKPLDNNITFYDYNESVEVINSVCSQLNNKGKP